MTRFSTGEVVPTFNFVENSLDDARHDRERDAENSSRPALVEVSHTQTGVGQTRVKEPITFPVVFRTEPHFTCGSAVITNPAPNRFHDPRGSSGVYAWRRNRRGLFTGAYIWVRLDYASTELDVQREARDYRTHEQARAQLAAMVRVKVKHFLTFTGTAVKEMPNDDLNPALPPRTTGV